MRGSGQALVMAALQSADFRWKYTACYLCSGSHLHSKANSQRWGGEGAFRGMGKRMKSDKIAGRPGMSLRSVPPCLHRRVEMKGGGGGGDIWTWMGGLKLEERRWREKFTV